MMQQRKSDHPIYLMLGVTTKSFLESKDSEIIDYFDDSYELIQKAVNLPQLIDYSPLVISAFKGLEKWFFLIAPTLNIPLERIERVKAQNQSFGSMVSWEELEKLFEDVLEKLNTNEQVKEELRAEVGLLKSFLKTYRSSVAHCWKKIESPTEADLHFKAIIGGLRRITEKLIGVGILL